MEKKKHFFCAWVNGDVEDLNRAVLREEFSKFGEISKIFVDVNFTFAKVYLSELENLKVACDQLNGFKSWKVRLHEDLKKRDLDNRWLNKSFPSANQTPSTSSNGNSDDMEEDCTFAGDYVDVHGKPVEVLQAENGELFVNLNDVRTAGFNIYKRESYENATISRDEDLRHLENYLLDQGRKYILDMKKTFNENEMLGVFERVKQKLQSRSVSEFGEGRVVNSALNSRNFIITKSNVPSTAATGNRAPRVLSDNFQPSFSHVKPRQIRDSHFDGRRDRQNGPAFAANGPRRSYNSYDNRNDHDDDRRKSFESYHGFTEANQNQMRKPRYNGEVERNVKSKAMADSNANEEPEESWEGGKTTVPKSKPQNDASSVSSDRKPLHVDRTVLATNALHTVKVSYVKPDKKSLLYAQCTKDSDKIDEILLKVNTTDCKLPEIAAPLRDMLCTAYFDGCWYRGIVLKRTQSGGVFVELIDYGNKEIIKTPLREMSEEMKEIPGKAIRIAIHTTPESDDLILDIGQELEVFVKRHYDDLTHLVDVRRVVDSPKLDEEPSSPPSEDLSDPEQENCFMQIPPSTAKLINGESVMIVGYTENKFILRNRETAQICKDIYNHLLGMEKKPVSNPKVGQLVLCSRDGMEGLHRAVIKQINNQVVELEYLDYYGGETLSLKSIRNVDKLLATYPIAKLESPVVECLQKVTERSDPMLSNLVMNKTKVKLVLDGSNFDLQLSEGAKTILLSEKIEELESPPKVVPEKPVVAAGRSKTEGTPAVKPSPKGEPAVQTPTKPVAQSNTDKFVRIIYDDMPLAKAKMGTGDYICYSCKGDSITLISASDGLLYMESLVITEPTDTVPYEPEELYEMCLAKFEDTWCRASLTKIDNDTCDVFFVDFGNIESVPKSDLRSFPEKLANIPILGLNAYFVGLPDDPKIHARLRELIEDNTSLVVDVKIDLNDDLKYGIEIPSIYATLGEEKLI